MSLAFGELAASSRPGLDAMLLALAGELGDCDAQGALDRLETLGAEIAVVAAGATDPQAELDAVVGVLGGRHRFVGDRDNYDDPANSMLDRVLERRTGLPILLSIVYIETSRRAGIDLAGVGLPGHYVVGHFGGHPPLLVDPFAGGVRLDVRESAGVAPWGAHQTVLRVLNNLVGSYRRRSDIGRAIRAAELRLELPLGARQTAELELELKSIRSALN